MSAKSIKEQLSGVFAPMCTPFTATEEVDYAALAHNVKKMNGTGITGYFTLGTNGEYKTLNEVERLKVLETVVKNATSEMGVMAGAGEESTRTTIETTKAVASVGAQLVSILLPHFFVKKMTDDAMVGYILEVADGSPVPVVLYNNPSVSGGLTLKKSVLDRVAHHPNVVGIKDSAKETYIENLGAATDSFFILAGSAGYFLDLLKKGGTGGVLSLANVFPKACGQMYRLYASGKIKEAEELDARLVTLNKQVSGSYGVAGVKAAMDFAGFVGGNPRKPLPGLSAAEREELQKIVKASGFVE